MLPDDLDVLVIGAGTAGAVAAWQAAATGRQVHLVDAGAAAQAGARWWNGVPGCDLAALDLTPPPEAAHQGPFHLVAGWGPARVSVREHDLLDVDMGWLVQVLQDRARAAGAVLVDGARVQAVHDRGDIAEVDLGDRTVRAALVIDAAGLRGPTVVRPCPRERLCVAAQQTHALLDPDAALTWLDHHGAATGETLSFTGVAGGFSVVNALVDVEHGTVSLLTGSIPGLGHASGPVLLERFAHASPWIGDRLAGGSRAIPLVAPRDPVGAGRVLRLGDAARQVFAAHGSGIAQQLRAARILGEVLQGGGNGDDYERNWRRAHGRLLNLSARFAAASTRLGPRSLHALVRSGLLRPARVRAALEQRLW